MFRCAAFAMLLLCPTVAVAAPADCAASSRAPVKFICEDATLSALDRESARLADLAAAGAQAAGKKDLLQSEASFRKTLAACRDAKPCLQRTLIDHIFHLRQGYSGARAKDAEGISLGPFVGDCPGLDALVSVTFVNSAPAFAFLAWRDKTAVLTQAVAASGARYTGPFGTGEAQFWNKGDQATLDLPGRPSLTCRIEQGG
ncbi:MAG: MliC family protein [Methylocystis sp.]|uniref:MliC family protein n=1 Tax=Methylocystis sp. TaxID=1911079 RepID=UPI003DA26586